ncbi:hypothetical protein E2C01_025078 [Portunus trituberculatus]|uniref:Uncharacterized protein n=1 Tax=Portunus trituberculatus TaxID=210409 RepID=A0A5B7ECC1_PORTR|nr:hypothetical protein [Portunus trituberculatus]
MGCWKGGREERQGVARGRWWRCGQRPEWSEGRSRAAATPRGQDLRQTPCWTVLTKPPFKTRNKRKKG